MTQAIAENNYQLYQQLYNEAVRVDQALQSQSQFNASMALQQYQAALDRYYNEQNAANAQQESSRSEQFAAAELLAQAGDYSAYGELFGWDDAKVQQMQNAWLLANQPPVSGGSTGKGAGTSSGGSGGSSGGAEAAGMRRRKRRPQAMSIRSCWNRGSASMRTPMRNCSGRGTPIRRPRNWRPISKTCSSGMRSAQTAEISATRPAPFWKTWCGWG